MPPDQVSEFSAPAAPLSYCVLRAVEAKPDPSYAFHLTASPDQREFVLLADRTSDMLTMQRHIGLELRFLAHGAATTVEMRKGTPGGRVLSRDTWPLIETCVQSSKDAGAPPAAAVPTAARPTAP